jgi:hypothetical protein
MAGSCLPQCNKIDARKLYFCVRNGGDNSRAETISIGVL